MAHGHSPYHDLVIMHALKKISSEPAPSLQGSFSKEFHSFVDACLEKDPELVGNNPLLSSYLVNFLFLSLLTIAQPTLNRDPLLWT